MDRSLPPCRQKHTPAAQGPSPGACKVPCPPSPDIYPLCPGSLFLRADRDTVVGQGLRPRRHPVHHVRHLRGGAVLRRLPCGCGRLHGRAGAAGAHGHPHGGLLAGPGEVGSFSLSTVPDGRGQWEWLEVVQEFKHPLVQQDPQPAWLGDVRAQKVSWARRTDCQTFARGSTVPPHYC